MARRTIPVPVSRSAKSSRTKPRKRSSRPDAPSIADRRSLRVRQETARRITSAASLAEFAVHEFVRAQKKSTSHLGRRLGKNPDVTTQATKPRRRPSKAPKTTKS